MLAIHVVIYKLIEYVRFLLKLVTYDGNEFQLNYVVAKGSVKKNMLKVSKGLSEKYVKDEQECWEI